MGPESSMSVIRLLIEYGADVNAESFFQGSPLHRAVRLRLPDVAEFLLENGANVNMGAADDGTPVQLAALMGFPGMICLLLKHGANVNTTSNKCGPPLQAAIETGSLGCVKLLLENGADASLQSGEGYPNALEKARRCWEGNQNWKRREIFELIQDCFEERGFLEIHDYPMLGSEY
ncbi:ankyrin repeat-containing domain protein [Aspergillus granulosus]|uniref:Ankyrin repeat-containing domain protein n=1 Tax=Aspergillus granulosus TaxID=176169 RepID=A0ABR4H5L3_9EURO